MFANQTFYIQFYYKKRTITDHDLYNLRRSQRRWKPCLHLTCMSDGKPVATINGTDIL